MLMWKRLRYADQLTGIFHINESYFLSSASKILRILRYSLPESCTCCTCLGRERRHGKTLGPKISKAGLS